MYSVNIKARQHPGVFELSNISKIQQGEQEMTGLEGQLNIHTGGANQNAHSIDNISNLRSTLEGKEPIISKNSAFNKSFGNTEGTVCEGNDSRLSNSRDPNPHVHQVNDISGLSGLLEGKEPKFTKSSAFNKDFGASQGTVCEGDDSRLSDSRNPNPHSHSLNDVDGLTSDLSLKADKSSVNTTVTVVTGVDFTNESFITSTFKIVDGIIVEII